MKTVRTLYHLGRADFLERIRRYNFLITLGLTVYLGYVFVPPTHSRYATMQLDGHRGLYNSAYVGSAVAMLAAVFLSLAGFYLVKNALSRDIQTRVGEILAATPISRSAYTLGKALSNWAVLTAMVAVMALAAGAMQLVRGEDMALHPIKLLAPFLLIDLPVMAVVAAVAVLFETVSWLRRGFGNVAYFFLWIFALAVLVAHEGSGTWANLDDLMGIGVLFPSLSAACESAFPGCGAAKSVSMGLNFKGEGQFWDLTTFRWEGIHWSPQLMLGRLVWVGLAAAIAFVAARFFSRFDPAREVVRHIRRGKLVGSDEEPDAAESAALAAVGHVELSPLPRPSGGTQWPRLVLSELRLMLKGQSRWRYIVAAGLFVASLAVPVADVGQAFGAAAWIWPVLIWSPMGAREARHATESLVFSSERALSRQLPSVWLAGVVLATAAGGGFALRMLISGDVHGLFAWGAAALFIPSLALALGVLSGSSKLFEVTYTLWWYAGPMSRAPGLDFLSAPPDSRLPIFYFSAAGFLVIVAYFGRRCKLGYA